MEDEKIQADREISLKEVCDQIVSRHHRFEHEKLSALKVHINAAEKVDGALIPSLKKVKILFDELKEETDNHLEKERQLLFPFANLSNSRKEIFQNFFGAKEKKQNKNIAIDGMIDLLIKEHNEIRNYFSQIRNLTNSYQPSGPISPTGKLCMLELEELENDALDMMNEEETYLFPKLSKLLHDLSNGRP